MQQDQQILKTLQQLVQTLESMNQPITNSPIQAEIEEIYSLAGELIEQNFSRIVTHFDVSEF